MQRVLQHGEFFGAHDARCEVAGFSIVTAAADPTRGVARHNHDDAHFILLLAGHYLSTARGAGHLHAEPALIYNPPGTTHADTFPDRRGRFLGISISAARLAELGQAVTLGDAAIRIWQPEALGLAQRIARTREALELEALCVELASVFLRGSRRSPAQPPAWLVRAREAIHARACEPLAMTDIAVDAGVHPVYLARAFRRSFGCTPADYVRQCRVEQAALLVRTTATALAEIALACGFVDQSHLNRAFVRTFATSPGAYRRRHAR
jgi:AraC family transcriptional regulator